MEAAKTASLALHPFHQVDIKDFIQKVQTGKYRKSINLIQDKDTKGRLVIANYSKSQHSRKLWDAYTCSARGIVLDRESQQVVALPFTKMENFYNEKAINEFIARLQRAPAEVLSITEKVDGSLGICYYDALTQAWRVNTRGSFASSQAAWATQWLQQNIDLRLLNTQFTYLFEIIYSKNQIVVSYEFEGLVLISVYDKQSSTEMDFYTFTKPLAEKLHCRVVADLKLQEFLDNVVEQKKNLKNYEGWVITLRDGSKYKIKCDRYLQAHKNTSKVTQHDVWQLLSQAKDVQKTASKFRDTLPDEFYADFDAIYSELLQIHDSKKQEILTLVQEFTGIKTKTVRKNLKKNQTDTNIQKAVIEILQDDSAKDVLDALVWQFIRPECQNKKI